MNRIFYHCIDVFMVVYMDDLLFFNNNEQEHLKHLEPVLSRLQAEELYVSPKKCAFMKEETTFLGMIVGRRGIRVNPEKVEVVTTWPRPTSLTELRQSAYTAQIYRPANYKVGDKVWVHKTLFHDAVSRAQQSENWERSDSVRLRLWGSLDPTRFASSFLRMSAFTQWSM